MLDANIATQLKGYLDNVKRPIEVIAALDDSAKAKEMRDLLQEIADMSSQISFIDDADSDPRKPSFQIKQPQGEEKIRFAGIPMGHEFTSLVLALLHVGGHPTRLDEEVIQQIKSLEGEYHFETYISLSCQNCPEVVQALNVMAVHTLLSNILGSISN